MFVYERLLHSFTKAIYKYFKPQFLSAYQTHWIQLFGDSLIYVRLVADGYITNHSGGGNWCDANLDNDTSVIRHLFSIPSIIRVQSNICYHL